MTVTFTAHNIRLDDGSCTRPGDARTMDAHPWYLAARRVLETVFPGDRSGLRLADLGCLEGGYAVEFARLGFQVLGVDVRESNIAACNHVRARTRLPNLSFVKDDVANIAKHGTFDAIFCCGLLYHLDKPKAFLEALAGVTRRLLIVQTHFATAPDEAAALPRWLRALLPEPEDPQIAKFHLSELAENEGLQGRWYREFPEDHPFSSREVERWSSWENTRSFWPQREFLIQAIRDAGFDLVMEQFDGLTPAIADSMLRGSYRTDGRGTFIGIKTATGLR